MSNDDKAIPWTALLKLAVKNKNETLLFFNIQSKINLKSLPAASVKCVHTYILGLSNSIPFVSGFLLSFNLGFQRYS